MTEKVLRTIFDCAGEVLINMNDVFYYASADCSSIDIADLKDLAPVIEKYGYDAFIAYEAIKRGHDPLIPQHAKDPKFLNSKNEILSIIKNADEFGEFYELRCCIKDLEKKNDRRR